MTYLERPKGEQCMPVLGGAVWQTLSDVSEQKGGPLAKISSVCRPLGVPLTPQAWWHRLGAFAFRPAHAQRVTAQDRGAGHADDGFPSRFTRCGFGITGKVTSPHPHASVVAKL